MRERLDEGRYVSPGPLWWGFEWQGAACQAERVGAPFPPGVVLLDEIDKADSSVPKDLLECLGNRQFAGPSGTVVRCGAVPPLVVVTTNEERSLPDAFLRRCLVLQMGLPRGEMDLLDWLKRRGRAHFGRDQVEDAVLDRAAAMLAEDRSRAQRRSLSPPGGAEYFDLLRSLCYLGESEDHRLQLLEEIGEFALRKHPEDRAE